MMIADEMDLPLDKVHITLADARPELVFNQLTGGSNSMHSLYNQVRVAAAIAKGRLAQAAAKALDTPASQLQLKRRRCSRPRRKRAASYGDRSRSAAAAAKTAGGRRAAEAAVAAHASSAPPQRRIDALDAVTGRKQFAHGPRRPRRAADDGLPAADDQRHRAVGQEPGRGARRCPASPTWRSSRTPVRGRRRGRARRDLRPVHRRGPRADVDWGPGTGGRQVRRRRARRPEGRPSCR